MRLQILQTRLLQYYNAQVLEYFMPSTAVIHAKYWRNSCQSTGVSGIYGGVFYAEMLVEMYGLKKTKVPPFPKSGTFFHDCIR